MPTLPKILMPVQLSSARRAIYQLISKRPAPPAAAPISASLSPSATAAASPAASSAQAPTTSSFVNAGTVLDRPPASLPAPGAGGLGGLGMPLPPFPGKAAPAPARKTGPKESPRARELRERAGYLKVRKGASACCVGARASHSAVWRARTHA